MNEAKLRWRFWEYCKRAAAQARTRSRKSGVPCDIDANKIDVLFVQQQWRCAISGIELVPPWGTTDPFGPSLDRIVPHLGYVSGNVRVVCNIANFAMNQWGLAALQRLAREMNQWVPPKPDRRHAVWRRTSSEQNFQSTNNTFGDTS